MTSILTSRDPGCPTMTPTADQIGAALHPCIGAIACGSTGYILKPRSGREGLRGQNRHARNILSRSRKERRSGPGRRGRDNTVLAVHMTADGSGRVRWIDHAGVLRLYPFGNLSHAPALSRPANVHLAFQENHYA